MIAKAMFQKYLSYRSLENLPIKAIDLCPPRPLRSRRGQHSSPESLSFSTPVAFARREIVTWFPDSVRDEQFPEGTENDWASGHSEQRCNLLTRELFFSPLFFPIDLPTAYTEGVVVATCKGCNSKHLIADNLGSAGLDGDPNIEEYFKTRGMEDSINRVNREVFDLEKVLSFNTKGGSLMGDAGESVLEWECMI